mmetsp:Transcript_12186/g.27548  ORF Transcript_12186/g.27548 Transcript_12186/m.27548 type:complete len:104 (+) Transcript_12186:61-372(+)
MGEFHAKRKRVCMSRYSFSAARFGISFPFMVKWILLTGQNFIVESLIFTLSTESDKLIMQLSSSARSSKVTYFSWRRRFGRCSSFMEHPTRAERQLRCYCHSP